MDQIKAETWQIRRACVAILFVVLALFLVSCQPVQVIVRLINSTSYSVHVYVDIDRDFGPIEPGKSVDVPFSSNQTIGWPGTLTLDAFKVRASGSAGENVYCRIVHNQEIKYEDWQNLIDVQIVDGLFACDVDWNNVNAVE